MAEEEHHDNPIFGRKVFFLNPPYSIRKVVIGRLQEMEYEIYVIDDYHDAKNILRHYKDSICFVNIDGVLSPDAWFNFVISFGKDESLKSIFLGVISERMRKADKDQFLLKANIPAGLIPLNGKLDDITETFKGILEINGAKGRRQYVRAQCNGDKTATMLYTNSDKMFQFKLLDISSVGAAAILPPQFKNLIQVNSVLRDVTITLGTKQIILNMAVFAIKDTPQYQTLVLLFMKGTSFSVKSTVREYVFKLLESNMISSTTNEPPDTTDYNLKPDDAKKDDAFLLEVDPNELADEKDTHIPPKYDGTSQDLKMTNLF